MRFPLKILALTVAAFILLSAVTWVGTLCYWHWRIQAALRTWETAVATAGSARQNYISPPRESAILFDAGCRSLPLLVDALNSSKDPRFQEALLHHLLSVLQGPGPYDERTMKDLDERSSQWSFIAEGLDLERKEKLENFNAWWASNGSRYHQPWRVWSNRCYGD